MDGAFHLTPLDVRRYDFGTALRGYDKARVDQFREQVADELERLTRQNQELDAKARTIAEQLKTFRERDKAINDALVSAQQLRGEMREQAERERELALREARAEAERMLDEARTEVRRLEDEVAALARVRHAYLAQLRSIVQRQLAELDAAEGMLPPGDYLPAGYVAAGSEGADGGDRPRVSHPTPAWLASVPPKE